MSALRNNSGLRELALHHLVVSPPFREVGFLRLRPATELIVDSKQFHRLEGAGIFLRDRSITRTIEVLRGNILPFG